jgi:hypothetical protein
LKSLKGGRYNEKNLKTQNETQPTGGERERNALLLFLVRFFFF